MFKIKRRVVLRRKIVLTMILALFVSFAAFGCSMNNNSIPEINIEKFLNKKLESYAMEDEIISILSNSELEKFDGPLIDIKTMLTENEFERLISNRYFTIGEILQLKYDKSQIINIEYEKVSESEDNIVYKVKYIEKFFSDNKLKQDRYFEDEFTLVNKNQEWLISNIYNIQYTTVTNS